MTSPQKFTSQSRKPPTFPQMSLTKIELGFTGIQTGVGYGEGRDDRMGTPAGHTAEPQNQDEIVTVVLGLLCMPTPAVKILAARTGVKRKEISKRQLVGFPVVLFGDQTI